MAEHDDLLQKVFDAVEIAIFVLDFDKSHNLFYTSVNAAYERLCGHSARFILRKSPFDPAIPFLKSDEAHFQDCLNQGEMKTYEKRVPAGNKTAWLLFRLIPIKTRGKITKIIGTVLDITERKEINEKFKILSNAVEQNSSCIMLTGINGEIEYVNPKFFHLTGYTSEEVRGKNPRILKSGEQSPEFYQKLWETISSGQEWRGEFHNRKKNGEFYWESAVISPIRDESGKIQHYVAIKEDITLTKEAEKASEEMERKMKILAMTDPLTGVMNRRTGLMVLEKQIHLSRRNKKPLCIAFIDINGLKHINDSFGHQEGDSFILFVSKSILDSIRSSDTLCRLGGDEFLIIFPECSAEKAENINNRILEKIGGCLPLQQKPYTCSFSFGIEEYPLEEKLSLDEFIERADKKMYQQKKTVDPYRRK